MNKTLFVGFKGKNNSSGLLAESISPDHLLLTNSFAGLKRDIDSVSGEYDRIVLFGVDKNLTSNVRIEKAAVLNGEKKTSLLELEKISDALNFAGIQTLISDTPTAYLCNEAYMHLLEKYSGRAVLIHIPTIKNANDVFLNKMKFVFVR
ncbi:MAG: hypothetical protein IKI46_00360 [Lachnospiraceae bacterium]|nr:hypothetical protein [Lachnospiraceae bacterium]